MLRHIRANETYWFCRHCWQEMPNLNFSDNHNILGLTKNMPLVVKKSIYSF